MTFKEKLMQEHPDKIDEYMESGCEGCPHHYGYEPDRYCNDTMPSALLNCEVCWNREMPGTAVATRYDGAIKDSGERTRWATGAERDMHYGKGDMASIPWESILRLSKHYENGAAKYERWNFRKGIPVSSFIDSACRHLAKYQCGCDDEDHLAAAAFNVLGAMLMENTMPEMQDLSLREGKNTFGYFEKEE